MQVPSSITLSNGNAHTLKNGPTKETNNTLNGYGSFYGSSPFQMDIPDKLTGNWGFYMCIVEIVYLI